MLDGKALRRAIIDLFALAEPAGSAADFWTATLRLAVRAKRGGSYRAARKGFGMATAATIDDYIEYGITNVRDRAGNAAAFDGVPTWEVAPALGTLEVAPDGLSCRFVIGDQTGECVVTVTGDGRLGEDVRPVKIMDAVTIGAGDVAAFDLAGTVRRKEDAPGDPETPPA